MPSKVGLLTPSLCESPKPRKSAHRPYQEVGAS